MKKTNLKEKKLDFKTILGLIFTIIGLSLIVYSIDWANTSEELNPYDCNLIGIMTFSCEEMTGLAGIYYIMFYAVFIPGLVLVLIGVYLLRRHLKKLYVDLYHFIRPETTFTWTKLKEE
ncbi:MAG: hypothetical protein ACW97Z_17740 [Candidatus Hodarchaeales archaeon]|jgi:hypothetical protein